MTIKNTAIITGTIRDIVDFSQTIKEILILVKEGLIHHVVLSTWDDDIDKYAGLRKKLNDSGIQIVESSLPSRDDFDAKTISWAVWVQLYSLSRGLEAVPKGHFVFKLRTDKCAPYLKGFKELLSKGPPKTPLESTSLFEYKLCLYRIKSAWIFHMMDVIYYGHPNDLQSIITCNSDFDIISPRGSVGVEARWVVDPFYRKYPAINYVMKYLHTFNLSRALYAYADAKVKTGLPKLLEKIYAAYYVLVNNNFHSLDTFKSGELNETHSIAELYDIKNPVFISKLNSSVGLHSIFSNNDFISKLFSEGWMESNEPSLYKFVQEFKESPFEELTITDEEIDEVLAFEQKYSKQGARFFFGRKAIQLIEIDKTNIDLSIFESDAALISFGATIGTKIKDHSMLLQTNEEIESRNLPSGFKYYTIGYNFLHGIDAEQDIKLALQWIRKAVELRNVQAEFLLGTIYYEEKLIKNRLLKPEAVRLLKLAARRLPLALAYCKKHKL